MKHAPPSMLVKRLSSLAMVNPAAFIVLLAYIDSALLLLPQGGKWGSHAHSLHQIQPSIAKQAGSRLPCRGWHTQHHMFAHHTFASTTCQHVPKKYIRKKPILPRSTIKMDGSGNVLQSHCIRGRVILYDAFISIHSSQYRTWYLYHNTTTGTIDYWVTKRLGNDAAGKKGRPMFGGNGAFNNQSGGSENFLGTIATLGLSFGPIRSSSGVVYDRGCKTRS